MRHGEIQEFTPVSRADWFSGLPIERTGYANHERIDATRRSHPRTRRHTLAPFHMDARFVSPP